MSQQTSDEQEYFDCMKRAFIDNKMPSILVDGFMGKFLLSSFQWAVDNNIITQQDISGSQCTQYLGTPTEKGMDALANGWSNFNSGEVL